MLHLHVLRAQGKFAVIIGEWPHLTLSYLLTAYGETEAQRGRGPVRVTQPSETAGLAPPQGGSLEAGPIVLSPAGNRCAQQPGQRERRNEFGYVTGRPWRLSQAQLRKTACWGRQGRARGWAPGWRPPAWRGRAGRWPQGPVPQTCLQGDSWSVHHSPKEHKAARGKGGTGMGRGAKGNPWHLGLTCTGCPPAYQLWFAGMWVGNQVWGTLSWAGLPSRGAWSKAESLCLSSPWGSPGTTSSLTSRPRITRLTRARTLVVRRPGRSRQGGH